MKSKNILSNVLGIGRKMMKKTTSVKILVVEDDKMLSRALKSALDSEEGFDSFVVADGLEVYDAVVKIQPDVILLDIILPGMDGFSVLKQLKGDDRLKKIPVIVLSNLDTPVDVQSAKVLGAEKYILKAKSSLEFIVKEVKNVIK